MSRSLVEGSPGVRPQRLAVRIAIYLIAVVLVTAFASTYALTRIARRGLVDAHARSAEVFTQALTASLSRPMTYGGADSVEGVVEGFEFDPRTAFIEVTDPRGAVIVERVVDHEIWSAYRDHLAVCENHTAELGEPIPLDDAGAAIAFTSPIWDPPLRVSAPRPTADSDLRRLKGYVSVGLHDQSLPGTMQQLFAAELAVALVACGVLLPVVVVGMLRWLAPLRRLSTAVSDLAEGRRPDPVPERGRDELAVLARAFNAMVEKLFHAQRELERANERLEGEVARRTAQLRAANDRLEAEARDKDDFLRAVTHDLGAPVRNISGLAALLSAKYADALADDAVRKLDRIAANARQQTELIHDLLELSRIRTRPGKREWVDVGDVLEQLRGGFAYDLERERIELAVAEGMPRLFAERNRVRQLFQNLLDNAIKYMMDAQERRIVVEHDADAHHHHFAVADTGRGIAAKDRDAVFQVFRRAAHSGTDHVPGKGVGLAWVKTIVESYGGSVDVESELGRGTRVRFSLRKDAVTPDGVATSASPSTLGR